MKRITSLIIAAFATVVCGVSIADTIELYNGTILEGDFVGSSNGIVMFDTGDGIQAFPEDQVVGIFLSSGVAAAEAYYAAGDPNSVTLPAGTRLVIRTSDDIDSNRHSAGHRFRGQLEGALVVDGVTAVARGTFVHGRITQAQQAGRMVGSSELAVEFTDLMVNDVLVPISTGGLSAQTQGEADSGRGRQDSRPHGQGRGRRWADWRQFRCAHGRPRRGRCIDPDERCERQYPEGHNCRNDLVCTGNNHTLADKLFAPDDPDVMHRGRHHDVIRAVVPARGFLNDPDDSFRHCLVSACARAGIGRAI
jgi:hypothetical protein